MSSRTHDLDRLVRRLPLPTDDDTRLDVQPGARQALFDHIISQPRAVPHVTYLPDRRRPRRPLLVIVPLFVLVLGAAGWVVASMLTMTTTVGCWTTDTGVVVLDAVTGDPIADCAAIWEAETGQPAPPLAAYDNGSGGIAVAPAARAVPDTWRLLDPGTTQDARAIELRHALADVISGLPSRCHTLQDARAHVQDHLDRLALDDWSVRRRGAKADGHDTCTSFELRAGRGVIYLTGRPGVVITDRLPAHRFAAELRQSPDGPCHTRQTLTDTIEAAAHSAGIPDDGLVVHHITDHFAECARAYVNVAGRIEAAVYGP